MATLTPCDAEIVRINAPEFFRDPAFAAAVADRTKGIASWYPGDTRAGAPALGEFDDVFLVVDGRDCGDFPALPDWIVAEILDQVAAAGVEYALVWLTNLE